MILKDVLQTALFVSVLAWGGVSVASEYRAGEFLGLDLSKAVLSPKLLGPPTTFAPFPIEASSGNPAPQASADTTAVPDRTVHRTTAAPRIRTAHTAVEKPRGAARTQLARRHSNPLDAQASDRRIQVWPCNTGGICDWQRK